MDSHRIVTAGISAEVSAKGAELVSLRDAAGNEMLWQAGPEWPRHAPVLFPIVGRLRDDTLRHDGKTYTLGKHGFARDSQFEWTERGADRVTLRLGDSAETRQSFPFPFSLELVYAVADDGLTVTTRVTNPGEGPLACGVGAHPAFRWPLAEGVAKDDHVVIFETQETGGAMPVVDGLLGEEMPLPFDGRRLKLSERLFADDALVMPGVASRKVTFAALGAESRTVRSLAVSWDGFKDLGIWSKPHGAPFLCIEPWYGMASPIDWDGEFLKKPGILVLPAGETRDFRWSVKLGEDQAAT
ncbi:aldose 1-epimerase family protein [Aurantimonas sp. VKM B-3413]|uniref:aldose 1-epimerase family protein n=1 Tax=Aurantimonas sp. VKM B-3413 TaxID=2779401 RepID=UPI001E40D1C1|nr:aldose 1-epimerase family protein [Aurantimonas sp. VKM B-3413]MCB8838019.1 aldose 1-epimerase family protein [Aurantimonas sp. VKM B-3413]